jgi:hypothetical protein
LSDAGDAFQLEIHFADAYLANRFAGLFLDQFGRNAVVDDCGVVLSDMIVHHLRFIVYNCYVFVAHAVSVQVSMSEVGVVAIGVVMVA